MVSLCRESIYENSFGNWFGKYIRIMIVIFFSLYVLQYSYCFGVAIRQPVRQKRAWVDSADVWVHLVWINFKLGDVVSVRRNVCVFRLFWPRYEMYVHLMICCCRSIMCGLPNLAPLRPSLLSLLLSSFRWHISLLWLLNSAHLPVLHSGSIDFFF